MSHYFRIVLNVAFLVFSFGYLLPMLISMPDTMLVIAGIAYALIVVPGAVFYLNRSYVNRIIETLKEKF